jgi:hypothetical protein
VTEREPEFTAPDGTVRKKHYGDGKQPWDTMVELGWAPVFAAACALKYVRRYRSKNGEDDLDKGRWYYARLTELVASGGTNVAIIVMQLERELTPTELALLR